MTKNKGKLLGYKSDKQNIGILSLEEKYQEINKEEPIPGLEINNFANELAENMGNPREYNGVITGWFKRLGLKSGIKSVDLFNEYLTKLRETSDNANELRQTIIKNKIAFIFQVEFAKQRLQEEWLVEQTGRQLQIAQMRAEKSQHEFWERFYKEVNPNDLSENALMLLNLMTPRSVSTHSDIVGSSKSVQYGGIEEMARIKKEEKLLEIFMLELKDGLNEKRAVARKINADAKKLEVQVELDEWHVKKAKKDDD